MAVVHFTSLVLNTPQTLRFDVGARSQWILDLRNRGPFPLSSAVLSGQIAPRSKSRFREGEEWAISSDSTAWGEMLIQGSNPYTLGSDQNSLIQVDCTNYAALLLTLTPTGQTQIQYAVFSL